MPIKKSTAAKAKKPSAAAQAMTAQAAQATLIRNTVPQWFRVDPDQVPNNAGGFVWQISDKEQVIRYLIIGSEGGNYYQTPQQVSSTCASCVLRMTRTPDNFKWLINTIRQVSMEGRAAKQESTLLALATAIVFARTPADKTEALNAVKDCVRILTHMYMLIGYIKIFSKAGHPTLAAPTATTTATATAAPSSKVITVGSGIGRGIRRIFGDYFYSRTGIEIANLMTKYQNREGWTIKDVLTLIHIDPKKMKDDGGRLAIEHVFKTKEEFAPILATAPPTAEPTKTLLSAIKEIHTIAERPLQPSAAQELDRIVHLINTVGLCREQLPSQLFKQRKVWEALLTNKGANGKGKGMPLTALIRNLGKLSTDEIKIIEPRTARDQSHAGKQAYAFDTPPTTTAAAAATTAAAAIPVFPLGHAQHYTEYIFRRITDACDIKRTKIHPYSILVAMLTYKKGSGDKGGLMWTPNIHIVDALDRAFKLAFQNITPTGKRIKIALDVSGSMTTAFCAGSKIVNCATASVAMMMMTLYVERGVPPPLARGGATTVHEPVAGGRNPLWKTTQLPDGRTLYENTKTNECQFTKPQETLAPSAGGGIAPGAVNRAKLPPLGGGTPGGTPLYKNTRHYLGIPEPAAPASSSSSYGYGSSYTPPMTTAYLPELYPPPAIPSKVTICAFSKTLTELTNAVVGYMDATTDPATGLPTMTIADALALVDLPFSSTDCALPMIRALENNEQVDAFVIYTDSETFMGKIHPQVALEQYRAATGINAKLIVVGMTSNCLTIADPKDLNTLNLAGFDTATPRLINDFISGGILPPAQPPPTVAAATQGAQADYDTDEFVMLNAED